jgi:tetratricopeptide (TPR) repeat protein
VDQEALRKILLDAKGDLALLGLATVEIVHNELSDRERADVRSALEAASIPHWCTPSILTTLLESPSEAWWRDLEKLPVIEAFRARGDDAVNVHEATRLAIRGRLSELRPDWFRELSGRAAEVFSGNLSASSQIERVFHLFSADSDSGSDALVALIDHWTGRERTEDERALAAALNELIQTQRLSRRASTWAELYVAAKVVEREGVSVGGKPDALLNAADSIEDFRLLAAAYCLVGDVAQARGESMTAKAAFEAFLAIARGWTLIEPGSTGWQNEFAAALQRLVDVDVRLGLNDEAQQGIDEAVVVVERLAQIDPLNTGRKRDLAVTLNRRGQMSEARGDDTEAELDFLRSSTILVELIGNDPTNATWQRDFASTQVDVARQARSAGHFETALQASQLGLASYDKLVTKHTNVDLRNLAISQYDYGQSLAAMDSTDAAIDAFMSSLATLRGLTELDPENTEWQSDLASTSANFGYFCSEHAEVSLAVQFLTRAESILRRLTDIDSKNVRWLDELSETRDQLRLLEIPADEGGTEITA